MNSTEEAKGQTRGAEVEVEVDSIVEVEVEVDSIVEEIPELLPMTPQEQTTSASIDGCLVVSKQYGSYWNEEHNANIYSLKTLVRAYNGVGLATNLLAASALSVLITTQYFATAHARIPIGDEPSSLLTSTNKKNIDFPDSDADASNATREEDDKDFLINALSKLACHRILPECHYNREKSLLQAFATDLPNALADAHADSTRQDLRKRKKGKPLTLKGKKWKDRVLARKRKQQIRKQKRKQKQRRNKEDPQSNQQSMEISCDNRTGSSDDKIEETKEEEKVAAVDPTNDNDKEKSQAPKHLQCANSELTVVSAALQEPPQDLSSISTNENKAYHHDEGQKRFAQLVIAPGSVGVRWEEDPPSVPIMDTTTIMYENRHRDRDQKYSDCDSFVTARDILEYTLNGNHDHDRENSSSSIHSFVTAATGTDNTQPRSTADQVFAFFRSNRDESSNTLLQATTKTTTTAILDDTDTMKGRIWDWIKGPFSSFLEKGVLDSEHFEKPPVKNPLHPNDAIFGCESKHQISEPGKEEEAPKRTTQLNPMAPQGPLKTTILQESSISEVEVVVYGQHKWLSPSEEEPSSATTMNDYCYFCCWFDSSWYSSEEDFSHERPRANKKGLIDVSCEVSLGSTQASSSNSSSKSSWFGSGNGTKKSKPTTPWYVMPRLDPIDDLYLEESSSMYETNEKSGDDEGCCVSRKAILKELNRFQNSNGSEGRIMEMVNFPSTLPLTRSEGVVLLD
jgi:hypothetical protein